MYQIYQKSQQGMVENMRLTQLILHVLGGIQQAIEDAHIYYTEQDFEKYESAVCSAIDWVTALGNSLESIFEAPTLPTQIIPPQLPVSPVTKGTKNAKGQEPQRSPEVGVLYESLGNYWTNWSKNIMIMINHYSNTHEEKVRDDLLGALNKAKMHWQAVDQLAFEASQPNPVVEEEELEEAIIV